MVGELKEAAQPVVDAAKELAPFASGDLRDSITVSTKLTRGQRRATRQSNKLAVVYVGPSYGQADGGRHGHLIEFGTSAHINAGKFRGSYNPGVRPRPFMRPAWDANRHLVLDLLGKGIWKRLAAAARRLRRQAERGTLSRSNRRGLGGF